MSPGALKNGGLILTSSGFVLRRSVAKFTTKQFGTCEVQLLGLLLGDVLEATPSAAQRETKESSCLALPQLFP